MWIRIVNATLLVVTIVGAVLAYRAGNKHRELLAEQNQLVAKLGEMPIDDPTKIYVLALDTGEDLHFAWRMYVPASMQLAWQQRTASGPSTGWSFRPDELVQDVVRVRIKENDQGDLEVFMKKFGHSSGKQSIAERAMADLVRGHWDEIHVEQLGANGVAQVNPNEITSLLRLSLPDDLKQQGEESGDEQMRKRLQKPLLEVRFGPRATMFQQWEAECGRAN